MDANSGKNNTQGGKRQNETNLSGARRSLKIHNLSHRLYCRNWRLRIRLSNDAPDCGNKRSRVTGETKDQVLRCVKGRGAVRKLFIGEIHLWLALSLESSKPHIPDYANDDSILLSE